MKRVPRTGFGVLRAALPAVVVVMEFCWLFPWLLLLTGALFGRTPTPLLGPQITLLLMLLASLTVKFALARPWSLLVARLAVVGAGVLAGLTAVKVTYYPGYAAVDLHWVSVLLRASHDALPAVLPPVMSALAATLLWWRGVVLGERDFSHFEVDRGFRRGAAWSVLFVVFVAIYGDARGFALAQSAPVYLLAFFSLGLSALALSRLVGIWQESHPDEGQALAMNRHWLALLVGVVGLIILGAMLVSGFVNVEFRPALLTILRPLEPVVEGVFYVLFAIAIVVARLILLVWSRLPFRPVDPRRAVAMPPTLADVFKHLPPQVVDRARWGMVVTIVILLAVLMALAVARARRRPRQKDEDERESVWSTQAVLAGLSAIWRTLWARWRPAPQAPDPPTVASIRVLYREMLRIGASAGVPRLAHQTPYEYRPRLGDRLPAAAADVGSLTDAYVRVRYARYEATPHEVEAAQVSLERVKSSVSEPG